MQLAQTPQAPIHGRWMPRRSVFASLHELSDVEASDRSMVAAQEALSLDTIVLSFIRGSEALRR